ncbi:hypothetical protein P7K49_002084 [Saguinus oedipus]|uniref:Uncharacterized protein n=1 Tax=Saguinus oedipus TaxID=9490 RepID=A0ABQ9WIY4_SAGOE|nr:hypothetical protein P7K49_002084 [Saguinus oedipus]
MRLGRRAEGRGQGRSARCCRKTDTSAARRPRRPEPDVPRWLRQLPCLRSSSAPGGLSPAALERPISAARAETGRRSQAVEAGARRRGGGEAQPRAGGAARGTDAGAGRGKARRGTRGTDVDPAELR